MKRRTIYISEDLNRPKGDEYLFCGMSTGMSLGHGGYVGAEEIDVLIQFADQHGVIVETLLEESEIVRYAVR